MKRQLGQLLLLLRVLDPLLCDFLGMDGWMGGWAGHDWWVWQLDIWAGPDGRRASMMDGYGWSCGPDKMVGMAMTVGRATLALQLALMSLPLNKSRMFSFSNQEKCSHMT